MPRTLAGLASRGRSGVRPRRLRSSRLGRQQAQGNARQIVEPRGVRRDDRTGADTRGRRDEEVVRTARASRRSNVGEKLGVAARDFEVVRLDRNRREHTVDERAACGLVPVVREVNANDQFCGGDRCDGDIVLVADDLVQGTACPLGCDQDRGVEDQAFQRRVSGASEARSSRSSAGQLGSAGRDRSMPLTSRPEVAAAGAMLAIARPRRSTTNVSPVRSTSSRRDEKRLAASVAVRRRTTSQSDYRI